MPLLKYFCFVGSALVALLFVVNCVLPDPAKEPTKSGLEDYGIRIRSTTALPDRVVFDTSVPTIVPPPSEVAVAPQAAQEAFAQLMPVQVSLPTSRHRSERKRKSSKHDAYKAVAPSRSASPTKLANAVQLVQPPVVGILLLRSSKSASGKLSPSQTSTRNQS